MKNMVLSRSKKDVLDSSVGRLAGADPNAKFYPSTLIPDRSMWGLRYHLQEYDNVRAYFEHGFYFGDVILPTQRLALVDTIITQSPARYRVLRPALNKNIVAVGNYMYHVSDSSCVKQEVEPFYLYFPAHSTRSVKNIFSIMDGIREVKKAVGNFKVKVAVFHLDFTEQMVQQIKMAGAEPLCFGHRYNPYFLLNLKRVMCASRGIFTSDIGSHVGYALAVGKVPVYFDSGDHMVVLNHARYALEMESHSNLKLAEQQKDGVRQALVHHASSGKFTRPQTDFLRDIFGLR